jgi:hypothetical protein
MCRPRAGEGAFAAAPDILGDAAGTIDRSARLVYPIRAWLGRAIGTETDRKTGAEDVAKRLQLSGSWPAGI